MRSGRGYAEGYSDGRSTTVKGMVYETFKALPYEPTADEVASHLGLSVLAVRPEVCHLHQDGLIEKTGVKRKSVTGMPANTWRLVKNGSAR